jgi:hypothetical protein
MAVAAIEGASVSELTQAAIGGALAMKLRATRQGPGGSIGLDPPIDELSRA